MKYPKAERTVKTTIEVHGVSKEITLCAYYWSKGGRWGHGAYCPEMGIKKSIEYFNRTWEAWVFDTVLACLKEKCERAFRTSLNAATKVKRIKTKQLTFAF